MARKNTLKKLLMYLVVLVGVLFVAFMAYYFGVNNETIALTVEEGDTIYMNLNDVITLPVEHTDPHRGTEITVVSSNSEVATYSEGANTIVAIQGGVATFTVTTTNSDFGPFRFDVLVGDGSVDNPWYVSTSAQLNSIGKPVIDGEEWSIYDHYELLNNITLTEEWTPIANFYGTISGEGYTISNLTVNSTDTTVGIFGTLQVGAKFENVVLSNLTVRSTNSSAVAVGGIAGINNGFIGKVQLTGNIYSASESAYVGSIAGENNYLGSRPTISTVNVEVNMIANGIVGGIAGENIGGIIFNAIVDVKSLDFYVADTNTMSNQLDAVTPYFIYGGIVGYNNATLYTSDIFRQGALKNVWARTDASNLLTRNSEYISDIALVAYQDVEVGTDTYTYAIGNVFENITVQTINNAEYFIYENGAVTTSIRELSATEMQNASNYTDLTGAWSFDANLRKPTLDISLSYEAPKVSDPGSTITSEEQVVDAFVNIVNNIENEISYTVDATNAENNEIVIDVNDLLTARGITTWSPIGTKLNPYEGKFIVKNGYVVFENLTITVPSDSENIYWGFFGVISGANTEIENIKFRNVTITGVRPFSIAGTFAGCIEQGYISNVVIDNVTITNMQIAGFFAGEINGGKVENVSVGENFVETDENLITNSLTFYNTFGGITAILNGTLENATVNNATINQAKETSTIMGGVVGKMYSKSVLKYGFNNGTTLNSTSGVGYYGGVVGYITTNTLVESSYNLGTILNIIGTNEENYAGGIAAYVGSGSIISKSFSNTQSIKNKNVGGIVAINNGTIRECYSLGEYYGQNVGGLAYYNAGIIAHSYTRASLYSSGNSSSYAVAGLVVTLPKEGSLQFVFSSAYLQAPYGAKKYAETRSAFRYSDIESFFSGKTGGVIKNYVVINYGDAKIQNTNFNFGHLPNSFIETDETSVMGMGATNPFEKAEFFNYSPQIWTFEEGQWPELANVVVSTVEE